MYLCILCIHNVTIEMLGVLHIGRLQGWGYRSATCTTVWQKNCISTVVNDAALLLATLVCMLVAPIPLPLTTISIPWQIFTSKAFCCLRLLCAAWSFGVDSFHATSLISVTWRKSIAFACINWSQDWSEMSEGSIKDDLNELELSCGTYTSDLNTFLGEVLQESAS